MSVDRDDLVHLITHDIQNHLSAILAFLDLARNGSMSADEALVPIADSAANAVDIAETVRTLYRIDDGRLVIENSVTSLNEAVDLAIEVMEPRAAERRCTFDVHIPKDTAVIVEPVTFTQKVVTRLIREALSSVGRGASIAIRAEDGNAGTVAYRMTIPGPGFFDEVGAVLTRADASVGSDLEGARRLSLRLIATLIEHYGAEISVRKETAPEGVVSVLSLTLKAG